MSNYFSMEIKAPDGLGGIESHLSKCKLCLEAYNSGYNGKVILRAIDDTDFEWSMRTSDSEIIFCSGDIFKGQEFAIDPLESLSVVLRDSSFPHIIWIDDENRYLTKEFKFDYEPRII